MTKEERITMLKKELAKLEGETIPEYLKLKQLQDECARLNANQVPVIAFRCGTNIRKLWLKTYGYKNIEKFATTMECLKALIKSDKEDFTRKDLVFINKTWFPTLNASLERFEVATTVEKYSYLNGYSKEKCEPYIRPKIFYSDRPFRNMIAQTFNEQGFSHPIYLLIPTTIECFKTIVPARKWNAELHRYEEIAKKEVSVLRYHYNKEVLKELYKVMCDSDNCITARELLTRTNDEIARLIRKRNACEKIVNLGAN